MTKAIRRVNLIRLSLAALLLTLAGAAGEAALEFRENEVEVTEAGDGRSRVRTGEDSKAQLSIVGGVVRMGSKTESFLSSNRSGLDLKQGVMMVSSERKGLRRQNITVDTPVAEIDAKATMLINYQPLKYIKITCIEGTVSVTLRSLIRETVEISEGQALIINCLEDRAPRLFDIDLRRLLGSSALVGGRFPPVRRVDSRRDARGASRGTTRRPPVGGQAPPSAVQAPPSRNVAAGPPRNNIGQGRTRLPPSQSGQGRESRPPTSRNGDRRSGGSRGSTAGTASSGGSPSPQKAKPPKPPKPPKPKP